MKSKNKKLRKEFIQYCKDNPEQRFWQALRNWSGYPFILVSKVMPTDKNYMDTFYWEDKTK